VLLYARVQVMRARLSLQCTLGIPPNSGDFMKSFATALIIILALSALPATAGDEEDVSQAVAVAQSWLPIVDAGKFGESWELASVNFQKGITKPAWILAVGNVRKPIGTVKSRIVMKGVDAPKVAKLPEGTAVIIQFATVFDKLSPAIETVTPFRDPDGTWRVAGYYIKPAPPPK